MPTLGTKDDLAELVRQAHDRKLRVIIDLNVAYTSNEAAQFKDAYNKPNSQYSDWYQWTNTAHTAFRSHANLRTRPLLNHANSAVQSYLAQVARDWLDVGVDGFRLSNATSVPHDFWKSFRQAVKQTHPNALLLGEVWESDPAKLAPYFQSEFDALLDVPAYYAIAGRPDRNGGGVINAASLPSTLDATLSASKTLSPTFELVRFVSAHNTNRIASLAGSVAARKRMAAVLLMTLPGVPAIYYGDEIGMPGYQGMGASGDDYRRAPMDWYKSGKGAGMPTWFKDAGRVNKANDGVSVEEQQTATGSLWSIYQILASHRAEHAALRGGNWQSLTSACRTCYAYVRWDDNDVYLVAFNFSGQTQSVSLELSSVPRLLSGSGTDLFQGGLVSLPSGGRYTVTLNAWDVRVLHWGK
jgi:glycosidase